MDTQLATPRARGALIRFAPVALILALAALVRLVALDRIPPGLWYDEAIYALDALSIGHGNWPIFFTTEGHPREPLYIYSLAGFFALFGHSVLKARLVSALWGILTVAAFYPFARRVFRSDNSKWPLAALFAFALFRWHVHFSRAIFRAMLPPLFILLCFEFFVRWRETRRQHHAVLCGFFLGAGLYTYLSFRFIPLLLAGWIVWLLAKRQLDWRRDWRGLALIYGTAFVVFLPLGVDYVRNPSHFSGRTGEVSMFVKRVPVIDAKGQETLQEVPKTPGEAIAGLASNALDVARMWTIRGDHVGKHNLPYAPVFDWVSGIFFYLGLLWCLLQVTRNEFAFLMLLWLFLLSLTSVFSFGAPNILRMQGATPAVILIYILGLRWAAQAARPLLSRSVRTALVGALLLFFAALQMDVYFRRFPRSPQVQEEFQKGRFYDPGQAVLHVAPEVRQVYVPESISGHPSFRFITAGIGNLRTYSPAELPDLSARPAAVLLTYISLQMAQQQGKDLVGLLGRQPGARVVSTSTTYLTDAEGNATPQQMKWSQLWLVP